MALHDAGELTCPRCGATLEDMEGSVSASVDEAIRVAIECPACEAPLEIVVESALPEALGVDVWIEDRRDDTPNE